MGGERWGLRWLCGGGEEGLPAGKKEQGVGASVGCYPRRGWWRHVKETEQEGVCGWRSRGENRGRWEKATGGCKGGESRDVKERPAEAGWRSGERSARRVVGDERKRPRVSVSDGGEEELLPGQLVVWAEEKRSRGRGAALRSGGKGEASGGEQGWKEKEGEPRAGRGRSVVVGEGGGDLQGAGNTVGSGVKKEELSRG